MEPDYYCPKCGKQVQRSALSWRDWQSSSVRVCYPCNRYYLRYEILTREQRDEHFSKPVMKHPKAALWEAMGEPNHG